MGKVKPMKALQLALGHCVSLQKLGEQDSVTDELVDELDSFTCAMYGRGKMRNVNLVRHSRIKEICEKQE